MTNYAQRWYRVFTQEIARRGLAGALGVAIGILARATARDWALERELKDLEQRRGIKP